MNKNLQDLAWSILPKEFKEEVKKEYRKWFNEPWWGSGYLRGRLRILRELFGEHNLTSDSEGEVVLTVSRKEVMNHFREACLDRIYYSNDSKDYAQATGRKIMLVRLFGKDKCLPDDKADEKVDDKVDENAPYENASDIDSFEQTPAEPKYKLWDLVVYDGAVHKIVGVLPCAEYYLSGHEYAVSESDLEPYTEPDTSHETPVCENHSDETSQKEANVNSNRNLSQNIANCDKQLDNILKDSFRNERRLNIAAMAMQGILSNSMIMERFFRIDKDSDKVARCALTHADALIAECEKGGSHEKA